MSRLPVFEPLSDAQIEEINVLLDGCFMDYSQFVAVCIASQILTERYGKNAMLYSYWAMGNDKRVKYTW